MSEQTQDTLDWIRQQCDRFLDESPTYAAYVRDVFQVVAENHSVDGVALVAFSKTKEPRIVAESNLSAISQDDFFNIDLDHVSLLHDVLREGKPQFVADRSLPGNRSAAAFDFHGAHSHPESSGACSRIFHT